MPRTRNFSFSFNTFSVEGTLSSGANGIAPDVGQHEPDTDWHPI